MGGGVIMKTPHVSQKLKDPWGDHVGYHKYACQVQADKGKMTKRRYRYAKARMKLLEKQEALKGENG